MEEKGANHDGLDSLRGTTLWVYQVMIRHNRPMSLRQIQHNAELSSPSLALYHIRKLIDMELIEADSSGDYVVVSVVKTGVLRLFVGRGRVMAPRYVYYSLFFLGELVGYLLLVGVRSTVADILLVISLVIMTAIGVFEGVMLARWHDKG